MISSSARRLFLDGRCCGNLLKPRMAFERAKALRPDPSQRLHRRPTLDHTQQCARDHGSPPDESSKPCNWCASWQANCIIGLHIDQPLTSSRCGHSLLVVTEIEATSRLRQISSATMGLALAIHIDQRYEHRSGRTCFSLEERCHLQPVASIGLSRVARRHHFRSRIDSA